MSKSPHAARPAQQYARLLWSLALLLAATHGPAAWAAPLENSRHGGLVVGSPVDPHPANILRNPAALGMASGTHAFLDGTLRLEVGRVRRAGILSDTGNPGPGADLTFSAERFTNLIPDGYFGFTTDLGSSLVVIGVALSTPFAEWQGYRAPVSGPEPHQESSTRYHRIQSQWFHLFVSPVVAIRAHKRLFLGFGMSYVRSMLDMSFARDRRIRDGAAPPFEDALFTERVSVRGAEDSFCVNAGIVVRLPRDVDVGISYRSRVVGVDQSNIRAEGKATVRRYDETRGAWHTYSGRARTIYELPDALTFGARLVHKAYDFGLGFEWARWSVHKDLRFTLTGNEFRGEAGMANWDVNFVHHRGFQDVFRLSLSAARRWGEKIKLIAGLLYESTAVPTRWVNPAAVDAHKLDLALGLIWRPHRSFAVYLGYGMILAPDVRVATSGYDPGHVVRCVEDRVDILWSESCRRTTEGKGLPTAAGRYFMMTHRFGLGVSYDYY